MYSAAIIPARYNSSRFPGKPLEKIGGISMIRRVYEIASSSSIDKVYIATDDSRIFDHVKSFGGEVIMTSSNCINGTERVAEAITHLDNIPEIVINIQGDEPFIKPDQIMQVAKALNDPGTGISTLKKKIKTLDDYNNPNIVKVITDNDDYALYFSRSPIPYIREKTFSLNNINAFYKHLGIYGFKTNILMDVVKLPESKLQLVESLEQLCWLENGFLIKVLETTHQSIAIDVPEDIVTAENWLKLNSNS